MGILADNGVELLGPDVPDAFRYDCDGCSCSPDTVAGVNLRPACVVHDWRYAEVRTLVREMKHVYPEQRGRWKKMVRNMRKRADRELLANMRRCSVGCGWFARASVAAYSLLAWRAVRRLGWHAARKAGRAAYDA